MQVRLECLAGTEDTALARLSSWAVAIEPRAWDAAGIAQATAQLGHIHIYIHIYIYIYTCAWDAVGIAQVVYNRACVLGGCGCGCACACACVRTCAFRGFVYVWGRGRVYVCVHVYLCVPVSVCVCVFSREHARSPRPSVFRAVSTRQLLQACVFPLSSGLACSWAPVPPHDLPLAHALSHSLARSCTHTHTTWQVSHAITQHQLRNGDGGDGEAGDAHRVLGGNGDGEAGDAHVAVLNHMILATLQV